MSKLYLTSVAVLCLLLTACERPPLDSVDYYQSADPISVTYTDDTGSSVNLFCKQADISYLNNQHAKIFVSYGDGTSQQILGDNISLSVSSPATLSATTDNGIVISVPELYIEVDNSVLSYGNVTHNIAGTALGFIIEDSPDGM